MEWYYAWRPWLTSKCVASAELLVYKTIVRVVDEFLFKFLTLEVWNTISMGQIGQILSRPSTWSTICPFLDFCHCAHVHSTLSAWLEKRDLWKVDVTVELINVVYQKCAVILKCTKFDDNFPNYDLELRHSPQLLFPYPSNTGYWSDISTQCWINIGHDIGLILEWNIGQCWTNIGISQYWPNIGPISDYIGPILYQYATNITCFISASVGSPCRHWFPWGFFFIPGNSGMGKLIPGIPGELPGIPGNRVYQLKSRQGAIWL